jgi:hypothetical protein
MKGTDRCKDGLFLFKSDDRVEKMRGISYVSTFIINLFKLVNETFPKVKNECFIPF